MPTEPEPNVDSSLTLSVWTPTAEEAAISRALWDQLAKASTPQEANETHRLIDEHWSEMNAVTAMIRPDLWLTLRQLRRQPSG